MQGLRKSSRAHTCHVRTFESLDLSPWKLLLLPTKKFNLNYNTFSLEGFFNCKGRKRKHHCGDITSRIMAKFASARFLGQASSSLIRAPSSSLMKNANPCLYAGISHYPNLRSRTFASTPSSAVNSSLLRGQSASTSPSIYFQRPSLPANTIIRFVPQQTAWLVERMGKFHRILQPGLAILIPFLDRIAYVKSLKEAAMEIPSQSAITADNVTLELDGVLYTRVFDAYKARYA